MAKDLEDRVGQLLVMAKLMIDQAKLEAPRGDLRAHVEQAAAFVDQGSG